MRTVRTLMTAMVASTLVVGGPLTAALAAEGSGPTTFTATSVLTGAYVENVTGTADGVTRVRADFQTAWTASDPRVSGTATFGVTRLDHIGATVHAGTFRLDNDGGSWEGMFIGFWDAAGRHFSITANGEGGYDGWTMVVEDLCECNTPTSEARGVIVPGPPPSVE